MWDVGVLYPSAGISSMRSWILDLIHDGERKQARRHEARRHDAMWLIRGG